MKKKRLLFVVDSLNCGGAEKSLVSLLSLVDYGKYDVDLQKFSPDGTFQKLLPEQVRVLPEIPYLRFCREGGGPALWQWTKLNTSLRLRLRPTFHGQTLHDCQIFWKYAGVHYEQASEIYDTAIAWGQGFPTYYVARKVCAGRKIAVVNADIREQGYNKWFDLEYYKAYDRIAAVSHSLHGAIEELYPELKDRMRVLYDIRNQSLTERMAREYDPYTGDRDVPILATVGRMASQKGYDLAVAAGAALRSRGIDFRWYLVGDGAEYARIKAMIEETGLSAHMFAVGAKENPYPYMKHADVYVQTSRVEGYCLTLSEARGLHTPPVSTNFGAVHEQLRHGENGLIVDMTPEAIADGIEKLLRDDALRESIRDTLRRERVGNEEEIERFYALLEE